jgi:hypothetical protein
MKSPKLLIGSGIVPASVQPSPRRQDLANTGNGGKGDDSDREEGEEKWVGAVEK